MMEQQAATISASHDVDYEDTIESSSIQAGCIRIEYRPALLVAGLNDIAKVLKALSPPQIAAAVNMLKMLFASKGEVGLALLHRVLVKHKIPYDDKVEPKEEDIKAAEGALESVLKKYKICVVDLWTFFEKHVTEVIYESSGDGKYTIFVEGPLGEEVIEIPAIPPVKNGKAVLPKRFLRKLMHVGLKLDEKQVDVEMFYDTLHEKKKPPEHIIVKALMDFLKEHPPLPERNRDRPWCSPDMKELYIQSWYVRELDEKYAKKLGGRYKFIRIATELGIFKKEEKQLNFGDAKPRVRIVDVERLAELADTIPEVICGVKQRIISELFDSAGGGERP